MNKFIATALFVLCLAGPAGAQMQPPIPMTPAEFANAVSGQQVKLVVRVQGLRRTTLSAELLDRRSDSVYKATGKAVTLYLQADTPIVMGSNSDIKAGAIVFVYGVATTPGNADVKKVVVVTPYVRVE